MAPWYVAAFMAHPADEQRRKELWTWYSINLYLSLDDTAAEAEVVILDDTAAAAGTTISREELNFLASAAGRGVAGDLGQR